MKYQVMIEDEVASGAFTLDELLEHGILDDYDAHIKVRAVGEQTWLIAREYPFHEKEKSLGFTIDEFGQIVRRKSTYTELSVSPTDLRFSDISSSKNITITSCGEPWSISVNAASWVHLTNHGTSLGVKVDKNYSSESRTDYFKIKSGDKEVKINIFQSGTSSSQSTNSSGDENSGCLWGILIGIGILIAIFI